MSSSVRGSSIALHKKQRGSNSGPDRYSATLTLYCHSNTVMQLAHCACARMPRPTSCSCSSLFSSSDYSLFHTPLDCVHVWWERDTTGPAGTKRPFAISALSFRILHWSGTHVWIATMLVSNSLTMALSFISHVARKMSYFSLWLD